MSVQRALPAVLVDFAWYQDGRGLLGRVPKLTLPEFQMVVEEYIAGGMAAPVDIVMGVIEKMGATITLSEPVKETIKLFGLANGQEKGFTFRGALKGPNGVERWVIRVQGLVTGLKFDDPERKKLVNTECKLSISSIKMELGTETVVDVDAVSGTMIIGGVDLRADVNAALGI